MFWIESDGFLYEAKGAAHGWFETGRKTMIVIVRLVMTDGHSKRLEGRTHLALNSDGEEKTVSDSDGVSSTLPLIISCGDACFTSGY